MNFFDEINSLEYLFLIDLVEPEVNSLLINVKEATISEQHEDLFIGEKNLGPVRRVSADGEGREYEFFFKTYVAYGVTNESFSIFQDSEERVGRLFCIYSKSAYLDYIKDNTFAENILDGEIKHYAINCSDHTIQIATVDEPIILRR